MTGKTHSIGGMLGVLAGYTYLESKGMLIKDVTPIAQLAVMYPFALYGSTFSDLDHHWDSAPSKDIFSFIINKILHLTTKLRKSGVSNPVLSILDAKHRSWQTHSDIFLLIVLLLERYALEVTVGTPTGLIVRLISVGFTVGIVSHLMLDAITPRGLKSFVLWSVGKITGFKFIPKKIALVPNKPFFSTGGQWEELIGKIMWVLCFVLLVRIMLYYFPYSISFT